MRDSLAVSVLIGAAAFAVVAMSLAAIVVSGQYPLIIVAALGAGIGCFVFALVTEFWTSDRQ